MEQLDSILEAQDNLKKNLQRMAEKLDKGRGTEIAVEQGNNSPPGPDGERGPEGRKGRSGKAGIMGPQVWLRVNSFLFFCSPPSFLLSSSLFCLGLNFSAYSGPEGQKGHFRHEGL